MKKFSSLVLISSILASCALAQGSYIGFEGSTNKTSMSMGSTVILEDAKYDPLEFGIKYGYDAGNFRTWGGYFYQANSSYTWITKSRLNTRTLIFDWKAHKILAGIDWTPKIASAIRLDFGVNFGIGLFQTNLDGSWTDGYLVVYGNGKTNAFASMLGTRVGAIVEIDKNNEIEFGIKGDFTVLSAKFDDGNSVYNDNYDRLIQGNYGIYLGYTYKF